MSTRTKPVINHPNLIPDMYMDGSQIDWDDHRYDSLYRTEHYGGPVITDNWTKPAFVLSHFVLDSTSSQASIWHKHPSSWAEHGKYVSPDGRILWAVHVPWIGSAFAWGAPDKTPPKLFFFQPHGPLARYIYPDWVFEAFYEVSNNYGHLKASEGKRMIHKDGNMYTAYIGMPDIWGGKPKEGLPDFTKYHDPEMIIGDLYGSEYEQPGASDEMLKDPNDGVSWNLEKDWALEQIKFGTAQYYYSRIFNQCKGKSSEKKKRK
jgi:hypothetical protein